MKDKKTRLIPVRCWYTQQLNEDRLYKEEKTEGGKEFHRLPV